MKRSLLVATAVAALIAGSGFANAQSASAPQPQTSMSQDTMSQGGKATAKKHMKRTSRRATHKRKAYGQAGPQTQNNAPIGSKPQTSDTIKEAPRVGDTSKVGGTPNADRQMSTGQNASPAQNLTTPPQTSGQAMSQPAKKRSKTKTQ